MGSTRFLVTPPIVTTDFLYLWLIGDRSIDERDFVKIQKDRIKEMQLWKDILKDIQKNEKNVKTAIVATNNHYAGFGPMTTKLFAEMMNLENNIRLFPLADYKIPLQSLVKLKINTISKLINNYVPRLDKQIYLNSLNYNKLNELNN